MIIIDDIAKIPKLEGSIITIGSFDGVHLAHQKILRKVKALAVEKQGPSVVITFDPHPRTIISSTDKEVILLSTKMEKIKLIEKYDIDFLIFVPFTVEFSQISSTEYVEDFIIGRFHPALVVLGYDHRFGLNRNGSIHLLKEYADKGGFDLYEIAEQEIDQITISSTKIRNALKLGDIDTANHLLGYNYCLTGKVVRGMKVGKTIGFPTANLSMIESDKLIPSQGIYAVVVKHESKNYEAMLYIGRRPSLEDDNTLSIEINIFDFNDQIYGHELTIEFLKFIRHDQKFNGLEALKIAISKDRDDVQSYFIQNKNKTQYDHHTAVVILNYNGRKYLEKFLDPIKKYLGHNHHLIIADNASTDDSLEYLSNEHPDIELILMDKNHGFAGGYNEALKQVSAKYYVLLNSDILIDSDWLTPIIQKMEGDETVGASQPKVRAYHERGKFEYAGAAGGWIDQLGYPFCRGRILESTEVDNGNYDDDHECFWATGAAMVVRSELFHGLGRFDDWYFAHQEEIDLCWRIKKAGYKVMSYNSLPIYHVGGGTLSYQSPQKTFLNFRNSLASLIKNEAGGTVLFKVIMRLALDGVAGVYFLLKGEFKQIIPIIKAHFSLYGKLGYLFKKRRERKRLVKLMKIGPSREHIGRMKGSIIWSYYAKGVRSFRDLGIALQTTTIRDNND